MSIMFLDGQHAVVFEGDINPNQMGEFPLAEHERMGVAGFTEVVRQELEVEPDTVSAKKTLEDQMFGRTVNLTFEHRADGGLVHSALFEQTFHLFGDAMRWPNLAITITEFPDGTVRGKKHYFRSGEDERVGWGRRPSIYDIEKIGSLRDELSPQAPIE